MNSDCFRCCSYICRCYPCPPKPKSSKLYRVIYRQADVAVDYDNFKNKKDANKAADALRELGFEVAVLGYAK